MPFEIIEKRVDVSTRGLVGMGSKTLRELFTQNRAHYIKHAVIEANNKNVQELINEVVRQYYYNDDRRRNVTLP